uniref:Uncharacterized protein n=1 Tax=Vespula pensylvanica TaxID=30213 RepID=A0A834UB95_VESPE|nr:hypothetical protein H0235_007138 [Vespula pensylvanica]
MLVIQTEEERTGWEEEWAGKRDRGGVSTEIDTKNIPVSLTTLRHLSILVRTEYRSTIDEVEGRIGSRSISSPSNYVDHLSSAFARSFVPFRSVDSKHGSDRNARAFRTVRGSKDIVRGCRILGVCRGNPAAGASHGNRSSSLFRVNNCEGLEEIDFPGLWLPSENIHESVLFSLIIPYSMKAAKSGGIVAALVTCSNTATIPRDPLERTVPMPKFHYAQESTIVQTRQHREKKRMREERTTLGPLCIPEIHCLAGSTSVAMHYVGAPTARRHLNAPEGNRFAVSPHPGRGHACRVARQRALNNAS